MENPFVRTDTVLPYDLGGYIWCCECVCHEPKVHGSGIASGHDFHRVCADDHLLQHCYDGAGAWEHGVDGCAIDVGEFVGSFLVAFAVANVYCE